jgi:hypothetical protein
MTGDNNVSKMTHWFAARPLNREEEHYDTGKIARAFVETVKNKGSRTGVSKLQIDFSVHDDHVLRRIPLFVSTLLEGPLRLSQVRPTTSRARKLFPNIIVDLRLAPQDEVLFL